MIVYIRDISDAARELGKMGVERWQNEHTASFTIDGVQYQMVFSPLPESLTDEELANAALDRLGNLPQDFDELEKACRAAVAIDREREDEIRSGR